VSRRANIFLPFLPGVQTIRYHLDTRPGQLPFRTERRDPRRGTARTGGQQLLDTRGLCNGRHRIVAVVETAYGTLTVRASFRVVNRFRPTCR